MNKYYLIFKYKGELQYKEYKDKTVNAEMFIDSHYTDKNYEFIALAKEVNTILNEE
jgi:hypothetical protein